MCPAFLHSLTGFPLGQPRNAGWEGRVGSCLLLLDPPSSPDWFLLTPPSANLAMQVGRVG